MPPQPKFREIMLAGSSEHWSLRFWFSCPRTNSIDRNVMTGQRGAECVRIVRDIMVEIVSQQPSHADSVEEILLQTLDRFMEHGCAAYEILNGDTRNGIVGYFEWP